MRILRYILLGLVVILVVLGVVGAFLFNDITRGPLPTHDGSISIGANSLTAESTGQLNDRVEVIRDEFGVPHVYASNPYDLFYAQGYVTAQDRWWQMEFSRATGDGRLQELTGANDRLMGNDIFLRTAGWRRAAERDIAEVYDEETLALMQAFSDGVNAYIFSRPKEHLALEYRLLGLTGVDIEVKPWTPADSVVWSKAMSWNLSSQLYDMDRAEVIETLGEDLYADFDTGFAYGVKPTILQIEDLPVNEETEDSAALPAPTLAAREIGNSTLAGNFTPDDLAALVGDTGTGSNSWAVSGELSATGMPLLANDPHLGIQMPSIWYEIGLHCTEISDACPYNVRGYALPAMPGVVLGHNDRIAWGFTNVGPDVMDVYTIKVNPDNPLQYEYNGEWEDMTVHEETIRFGDGGDPVTIQVRETRFGPIINDNRRDDDGNILGFNNENPMAMRWTALNPAQTLKATFDINTAQNWDDFREAASYFDSPSQNLLYADVDGNIGYQMPGVIPVRPAANSGLVPLDGSTDEFEWLGYVPFELLPNTLNPERGYIQTANQPVVPLEYYDWLKAQLSEEYGEDINIVISTDWADGYRGQRIVELLEAQDQHTIESFMAIQGDNKFVFAEEVMPYIMDVDMGDESLNDMRDWLGEWDFMQDAGSPQAALFAMFYAKLMNHLYDDQAVDINAGLGQTWPTSQLMDQPDNAWWDDVNTDATETRDDILAAAFTDAVSATRERLGENRDEWAYGELHVLNFVSNPLGASGIGLIENIVNRESIPTGGGYAVNAASYGVGREEFAVSSLASKRTIYDLGDFDNSVNMHTTGQSGHPYSAYYDNMIDLWRTVQYKPMRFSRESVEAGATSTLILEPAE